MHYLADNNVCFHKGCSVKSHQQLPIKIYDKYLATIGIRLPMPKAFGETRKIGGV